MLSAKNQKFLFSLIPLAILLIGALGVRLVFFTGIVRYDDINNAHYAFDLMQGKLYSGDFGYAGWRFALYLPVAGLYSTIGINELTTVAYPIFSSLLGITFVYGIGRLAANETSGLIAAFFWMLFPVEIHYASDLLPDVPMTALSTGAVFFFMLARRREPPSSFLAYGASAFCLIWATLTKAWAIATLFFLASLILLTFFQNKGDRFKQLGAKTKQIIIALIIGISFVIGITFVSLQPRPFLVTLVLTGHDILDLLTGKTFLGTQYTEIFLILLPLFVVSVVGLLANPKSRTLLLWAFFAYIYLEWGQTRLRLMYVPIALDWQARNLLQLLVPFFIVAGIHIGKDLSKRYTYIVVSALALFVPAAAWVAKTQNFTGIVDIIITIGLVIAILGAFASPFFRSGTYTHKVFASIFLSGFVLASLNPTPPFHFTEERYSVQSQYRKAMREVADYLLIQDDYPIYTFSDDTARDLNYASNFRLGHDWRGSRLPTATQRIGIDANMLENQESFYAVFHTDYRGPIPRNWWLMGEFGNLDTPIKVYRILSSKDAYELISTLSKTHTEEDENNLIQSFGAAVNSDNLSMLIDTWIKLYNLNPDIVPLADFTEIIVAYEKAGVLPVRESLLQNSDTREGLTNWEFEQPLEANIVIDNETSTTVIQTIFSTNREQPTGIYQDVVLSPDTVYILEFEIMSDNAVKILSLDGGQIEDSNTSGNIYGSWENVTSVFLTPHWNGEDRQVRLEVFTTKQAGEVNIRNVSFFEIIP